MTTEDHLAYLGRSYTRLREQAVDSVRMGRAGIEREANIHGALNSGRMLLHVKEEYDRAMSTVARKMVQVAHDLTESTAKPVCDALERGCLHSETRFPPTSPSGLSTRSAGR